MYSIADKLRDEGLEKGRQRILEEGLEQGLERGLERGKRETVVRAGKQGLSVTQIAAITGFSAQKVRAILRAAKRR